MVGCLCIVTANKLCRVPFWTVQSCESVCMNCMWITTENESNGRMPEVPEKSSSSSVLELQYTTFVPHQPSGAVGFRLHITLSLTFHTKQTAAPIHPALQFAHETCSWPLLVFLGPANLLQLNSYSTEKKQLEKCNPSADSRIYENRRMKLKVNQS